MCRRSEFTQSGWHLPCTPAREGAQSCHLSRFFTKTSGEPLFFFPDCTKSPPSLPSPSLHQHNSPAKPRTQEALRASTTNWSSSISLFLSVSLFPYHALFVRFKAFPLCFLPGSSKRDRGAGASETIALLSHWRLLSSPPPQSSSPWAGGILQCRPIERLRTSAELSRQNPPSEHPGGSFQVAPGPPSHFSPGPPLSPLHRCLCWR